MLETEACGQERPAPEDRECALLSTAQMQRKIALGLSTLGAATALAGCGGSPGKGSQIGSEFQETKGTIPIICSAKGALQLLDKQQADREVFEIETPSGTFTYILRTPKRRPSLCALRGIQAGRDHDGFLKELEARKVRVSGAAGAKSYGFPEGSRWAKFLDTPLADTVITAICALSVVLNLAEWHRRRKMRRVANGEIEDPSRPKERLSDIGGCPEVVSEMQALVEDIKRVQQGEKVKLPRGVLLAGGPGIGKTLGAKAVAGEASCPFLNKNSSEFTKSSYVGDWNKAVIECFKEARELRDAETQRLIRETGNKKARGVVLIFIDEFDTVGRRRSTGKEVTDHMHDRMVNAFLQELDGFESNENIVLMAATNRAEMLDAALLRPGRFTKQFHMRGPRTAEERTDVIQILQRKILGESEMEMESPETLDFLSKISIGKSPDDLRGILSLAVEQARHEGKRKIGESEIFEAFQRQEFGPVSSASQYPERIELVHYHEHGHGLLGIACGVDPVVVSMRPRGDTLGRVLLDLERLVEPPSTRTDLLKYLLILAGGRAGENQRSGDSGPSQGAGMDFEGMRGVARELVMSAMLDGRFILNDDIYEMTPEVQALMTAVCENAIKTASGILGEIREVLMMLVSETSNGEPELVGEAAMHYYRPRLTDEQLARMRALVQDFIDDPLATESKNS